MSTDTLARLPASLQNQLASLGLLPLNPVQQHCLPWLLDGHSVRVQAPTGSGKTAAFGLALLAGLNLQQRLPQGLVLVPSRELAEQVAGVLRQLGRCLANLHVAALYGGTDIEAQRRALAQGVHLVVGTPGRLRALLADGTLALAQVNTLVLDEADRLQAEGFADDLASLSAALKPGCRQWWLSATFPAELAAMAPPQAVVVDDAAPAITQRVLSLPNAQTVADAIARLAVGGRTLVFVNTKASCREVVNALGRQRCPALALHGDLNQQQREQTLVRFRHGSAPLLVATDLAARGLDIDDIERVICAEPANDDDTHRQRIGRTARAGAAGVAISLANQQNRAQVQALCRHAEPMPTPPEGKVAATLVTTLMVNAGRRARLRKGDLMGALIKAAGVPADAIVAIELMPDHSYVTLSKRYVATALAALDGGEVKGKPVKVRPLL
ncbi:DEAD/DEAH box helicase [Ferrimonas balearica]|uniref:DEAD/DEAH box helicase n=1 Tax=Ferrimonas balearica TaxID=44012 RepID=UPI001C55F839|nr:DEAD/DEAH box helicase [Ferrimonas balearica]MBW3163541.1 DEAD/DEAH box helicase [Ferrimonas balearica]